MMTPEERLMRVGIAANAAREIVRMITDGGAVDTPLVAVKNLSDLTDKEMARINLGLGLLAVLDGLQVEGSDTISAQGTGAEEDPIQIAARVSEDPDNALIIESDGLRVPIVGAGVPEAPDDGDLYARGSEDWNKLGSAATAHAADFATSQQGQRADTAVQPGDLGTAAAMSAEDFASAAQGGRADTALQPDAIGVSVQAYKAALDATTAAFTTAQQDKLANIASGATLNAADAYLLDRANHTGTQTMSTISDLAPALAGKVDAQAGYGLSQENFTSDEKDKLAGLEGSKWKGEFVSLAALQAAFPTAEPGSNAFVDLGVGEDVVKYIWDSTDQKWVLQQGESADLTPAQIKSRYESNPDTNTFTDAEKSKLSGIASNATNNTGTVTSVQVAVPQGLQASGGPITGDGTITISYAAGYSIPANSKQAQWDTSYGWGNHASAGYALAVNLGTAAARNIPAAGDASTAEAVLGSDTRLANAREWNAATMGQAEAEAGTATTRRAVTAQRMRQGVAAYAYSKSEVDQKIDDAGGISLEQAYAVSLAI